MLGWKQCKEGARSYRVKHVICICSRKENTISLTQYFQFSK